MDEQKYLKNLVESLTHSGNKTLNSFTLQNLIKLCTGSRCYVEQTHKLVMDFLKKPHSEVKLSSIQLIDELFNRFPVFETLILENIKEFFEEAGCLGKDKKIPQPIKTGKEARKLCFVVMFEWFRKHPENHLLKSAINFMEKEYHVDFSVYEIVDPKAKAERIEKERRAALINKEFLKKIQKEIEEMKDEMDSTLTSLQSCFSLLLPSPDEFSESNNPENDFEDLRLYGVLDHRGITVDIKIDEKIKIKEDDENSAILEAARDSYNLIKNRFLPKTITWLELLEKTDDKETLKKAQRQKEVLQGGLRKYEKLEIIKPGKTLVSVVSDDDTSDSDFEEVVPPKAEKVEEEKSFFCVSEKKKEPETKETEEKEKTRKSELLKIAPKLPFDIDLYHWEDTELKAPKVIPLNLEGSSIWSAPADLSEMSVPGGSESLRSRVIEFSGKFEPVKRACKARLPSGKLCPRHDRFKCPLHGVIVDRDDEGNIINEEDKEKVKPKKSDVPDWQDPALLSELKAKTGLDLEIPKKGQRLKKPKHPGLTDINKKIETAKTRIAKKVFDKKAVKRVAQQMDRLDHKRHRDKFGDQFNYIHDTS